MKTICIAGRLTRDAELRRTQAGDAVLGFSVAVDDVCSIDGCGKPRRHRGWCAAHYARWYKHGDPLGGSTSPGEPQKYLTDFVIKYSGGDCLIWPYERSGNGYGLVRYAGKRRSVHRLVCEMVNGAPPTERHHAAHICGNGFGGCVNPMHLAWKTPKENESDKQIHGTHNRGERSGVAKLTEKDVAAIRQLIGTRSQEAIAEAFGISRVTVSDIKRGKSWSHLENRMEAQ